MNWATKKKASYFPLNPGCLIPGYLFHGLWNDPEKKLGSISSPYLYPNQPGPFVFFVAIVILFADPLGTIWNKS